MVPSPNQAGIYTLSIVFILISAVAIALRYQARRVRAAAWKADDWLVFSAMLLIWGLGIILIYGASQGTIGTHTGVNSKTGEVDVTSHEDQISMLGAISQLITVITLGTIKFGMVMFYRRIFISGWFKKISLAILVLIAGGTVAFFFATLFECDGQHFELMWMSIQTYNQVCYRYKDIQLAHCVSDIATDLIVLSLLMVAIWKLRMTVRLKIILTLIILTSLLSTAAGIARLVIVVKDIVDTTPGAQDVRGIETNILVWSYVEVGVGVMVACLPTLKPTFDNYSLDSIVANVRLKVSLRSINFNSHGSSPSDRTLDSPGGLEMMSCDSLKQNRSYRQINATDSFYELPAFPTKTIDTATGRWDHSERENREQGGSEFEDIV
ncbi:hypothetical protein F5B20DRAFT_521410 [Whalleya microplaca]|nr:hypothetical protein F5B20DRAFT_521410 [Whalleya microplaca]